MYWAKIIQMTNLSVLNLELLYMPMVEQWRIKKNHLKKSKNTARKNLTEFFNMYQIKPNAAKAQTCFLHLRNKDV